ncbi:MAG: hypothetical protein RMK29_12765 [Myxococcales bacterium]|nr:hypothetical protein [Myxococcota bacterium]MDW8282577.1 hypothetical protein [Myxococcales bacterium]
MPKRSAKTVYGTYRAVAETTAQAMRIAEEYRRIGWTCSTRGRRLVLTTHVEAYLSPRTPVQIWQLDRSSHEEACRRWLVPELRGRRPSSTGLQGKEGHPRDQEVEDDHGKGG